MKNTKYDIQKGLTFVELMVTISIIFVTSLIVAASYPSIQKELAIYRTAHKIAQDLRRTQTAAMSASCSSCQIIFNISQKTSYQVLGETVNLEKGVEFTSLFPTSHLTISFSPPNPTTFINDATSGSEAEITITNGIRSKTVKINNAGRIQIE